MSKPLTYRKKPVVEVMQLIGAAGDIAQVLDWLAANLYPMLVGDYTKPETLRYHDQVPEDDSRPDKGLYIDPATGDLMIRTLEGDMRATYGDYIIKGVQGEFYPIKESIFRETYERVEVLRGQRDSERDRAMTARHELHMARQTVLSVRTAYDKGGVRLDAVRTFAADWEDVQAYNREAFSRGRIGYVKDAPTLDRLRAILDGGAA